MERCIYCEEVMLAEGEAGDRKLRPSREHIIPAALGGPDSLCTFDVCESCNSTLGETTDGDLMKEQIISIKRQKFGLTGHSSKIPDVVMKATSMQTGTAYKMRISPVGDVSYDTRPVVDKVANPDGSERVQVSGSREQVTDIVKGMHAKLARSGRKMLSPGGSEIMSVEDSVAVAQEQRTTEFKAQSQLNQTVIRRGIIKIAFGFAHLVLGPSWTFSPGAKSLRDAALRQGDDESVAALVTGLKVKFRDFLLQSEAERETRHVIALLPAGEEKWIAVSLFGEPLLTMAVRLQVTADQFEAGGFSPDRMMVSTLAAGGDVQWLDLEEFARRWARTDR